MIKVTKICELRVEYLIDIWWKVLRAYLCSPPLLTGLRRGGPTIVHTVALATILFLCHSVNLFRVVKGATVSFWSVKSYIF